MKHTKFYWVLKPITLLGSIYFFSFIILFAFFSISVNYALRLFFILIASIIIAIIIRSLYFKERPDKSKTDTLFLRIYNSSFPSIHAMRAATLGYLFSILYPNIFFVIIFWLIAILICYSRIYLKKHDFIDVLAGALIGLLLSLSAL